MSERIFITVNGKFDETDTCLCRRLPAEAGVNLLRLLKENGFYEADCGGNGSCGKCRVKYLKEAPLPTAGERVVFSPQELRDGCRLACRHTISRDTEIQLMAEVSRLPDIVMEDGFHTGSEEKTEEGALTESPADSTDALPKSASYFAIADIGTTTVAMQAVRDGRIIGSFAALNPQRSFGADVASRIAAAVSGHLQELSEQIRQCLQKGIASLREQCGGMPEFIVAAGNTTMNYLLRGISPEVLGSYPFSPVDTKAVELSIGGVRTFLVPGLSAFVGGDITAGILACGLLESGKPRLLLDLGTNGEMVFERNGSFLCTATAAGPAFEGTVSARMMGADLIDMTARLLQSGDLDSTGLLREPYFTEGAWIDHLRLTNQDIRELQKAKAAVAAGIRILLAHAGVGAEEVDTVYLAGGFGYYLKPESAVKIGLLPGEWLGRIKTVGNSALAGAKVIGERLKNGEDFPTLFQEVKEAAKIMNLAEEKEFAENYVEHMNFPENMEI